MFVCVCVSVVLISFPSELEKIAEKEGKKNEEGEKEREKEGENEGEEEGRKMCKHLNDQTRKAKLVQRASTDLFLRLFLHAQQQQQQQQQQQLQLQQNPLNLTNVVNSKSGKRGEKGEGRERTGEEYKATVYKLRNNGFLAYIPSLGIKGPGWWKEGREKGERLTLLFVLLLSLTSFSPPFFSYFSCYYHYHLL